LGFEHQKEVLFFREALKRARPANLTQKAKEKKGICARYARVQGSQQRRSSSAVQKTNRNFGWKFWALSIRRIFVNLSVKWGGGEIKKQ